MTTNLKKDLETQIALAEEFGFEELYLSIALTEAKEWLYAIQATTPPETNKNAPAAF